LAYKKTTHEDSLQVFRASLREKRVENLYIFHGEEVFLLHHYLGQVKKLCVDEVTESFNYHRFTNENFDTRSFGDAVENLPMMSERTMVQVDDVDPFKMNEDDRERMREIFSDIPEYCTVVFTFETVEWKPDKRQKKLWEAIDSNAIIVDFVKQNQRELISWILRHFAANQKTITPELCAYLIEITGGTMTALSGEIKKICAYSGSSTVTKSDIDAVTEPVLDAMIYQMTDLMSQKKYGAALQKLQHLLKMQEEPVLILGAVGNHFRRLSASRTLLDHGKGYGELMKLYGMGDYAAKKMMEASRRFSQEYLKNAVTLVLETDRKMKTSFDTPQRLLELLVLQLAGEGQCA